MLDMLLSNKITKVRDIEKTYQRRTSFAHRLPWRDYNEVHQCFLLEDNESLGIGLKITPIPCEAKPDHVLAELANSYREALKNSIPCERDNPWILQCYVTKNSDLRQCYAELQEYFPEERKKSGLAQDYLQQLQEHFAFLSKPGGIFHDQTVTNAHFQGNLLTIHVMIYRRQKKAKLTKKTKKAKQANRYEQFQQIKAIANKLKDQLTVCGLKVVIMDGKSFYDWMTSWFNPKKNERVVTPLDPNHISIDFDLAEELFFSLPESFEEGWRFDGLPHKVITIQSMVMEPVCGHITGERKKLTDDTRVYNLIDHLPEGSIFTYTIVFQAQSEVAQHLKIVENSAIGRHAQAIKVKSEINTAENEIAHGDYLLPVIMNVYIKGDTETDLKVKQSQIEVLLNSNGFRVISDDELFPIDAYLRYLPMCYDYHLDQRNHRAKYFLLSDIVKLLPFYGRSRGTGNPGIVLFNRGGEPWVYDVMRDKTKNAHLLLLGETGTGKSNFLSYQATADLALYNSILFIHEAGGSFDLWLDYCRSHGLSCHQIKIDLEKPVSLNPFAHGLKVIDQIEAVKNKQDLLQVVCEKLDQEQKTQAEKSSTSEADEPRDILGDMVIAALIMITGGEKKEEDAIRRVDRLMIMDAIIDAAYFVKVQARNQMRASDVVAAFERISLKLDPARDREKIRRMRELADGMRLFTNDPVTSQFFDSYGDPWPLVDVTVIDYGLFAREGYEAQRAIAFSSCMNNILALAEINQNSNRAIKVICDENHLFTSIPLLAQIETRITKMGRKLGLWLWIATQNMKDFPDLARRMLSQIEHWFCLALPPDEIDQIERFKTLTAEERALFLSARKEKGKYTEGVLLSPKIKGLFRSIPPRLFLAIVATDQDEKNYRHRVMAKYDCTEVEAVKIIAKEMMGQVHEG